MFNLYNPFYWYNLVAESKVSDQETDLSDNIEEDPQDFDIEELNYE